MKVKIFFAVFFVFLIGLLVSYSPKKYFYQQGVRNLVSFGGNENILILGKPGYGYYGSENTDSIILINIRGEKAFLIYIPRDLIAKVGNNLYKINSMSALNKKEELLREVEEVTGLPVNNYLEYDLFLVKKLIDAVGGVDVYIKEPIVDAVSGYVMYSGQHHLNGEWAEFVIRSRYAREGDFFRMKNQFEIIRALKHKIQSVPREDMLKLIKVLQANNKHYQTNLNPLGILEFLAQIEKIDFNQTSEIIPGFKTHLWTDGSFRIELGKGYKGSAYGLIPKEGIDKYFFIKKYINDEIQKTISRAPASQSIGAADRNEPTAKNSKGSEKIYKKTKSGDEKKLVF